MIYVILNLTKNPSTIFTFLFYDICHFNMNLILLIHYLLENEIINLYLNK